MILRQPVAVPPIAVTPLCSQSVLFLTLALL